MILGLSISFSTQSDQYDGREVQRITGLMQALKVVMAEEKNDESIG